MCDLPRLPSWSRWPVLQRPRPLGPSACSSCRPPALPRPTHGRGRGDPSEPVSRPSPPPMTLTLAGTVAAVNQPGAAARSSSSSRVSTVQQHHRQMLRRHGGKRGGQLSKSWSPSRSIVVRGRPTRAVACRAAQGATPHTTRARRTPCAQHLAMTDHVRIGLDGMGSVGGRMGHVRVAVGVPRDDEALTFCACEPNAFLLRKPRRR